MGIVYHFLNYKVLLPQIGLMFLSIHLQHPLTHLNDKQKLMVFLQNPIIFNKNQIIINNKKMWSKDGHREKVFIKEQKITKF